MDKNAIKKYAVWARQELISRVTQRAAQFEITEEKITDASADSVRGRVLSSAEKRQRQALIARIKVKDFTQVMEEIAYTWFNRFIALRFMEVNQYLPSHVRVFTDDEGAFKPQILSEAIDLVLDGLDKSKVYALKTANDDDALFKYLIIVQCNALSEILPGMFQRIEDYTELLFPDNLLRAGSVIEQMVTSIPEEDWTDQVQIIGWLYQYYNTEPKDQVFADLKKNIKISKEKIPAATQLFTPDWIVRYMVENSLGRLWVEGHPAAKEKFLPEHNEDGSVCVKEGRWNYYLEEAEQEPEVEAQLAQIRKGYAALTPEQLRVIDPCCGSGHILVYLFDVMVQIYEDYGYTAREAASSIVKHNLWGLDIDERAAQLSYFSVMMKARQYDRRFFSRGLQPHVIAIAESNNADREAVDYFCKGDGGLKKAMQMVITELHDAKEYGSILTCTKQDWDALYERFGEVYDEISLHRDEALALLPLVRTAEALSQQYDVVVTNPPYMGSSGMSAKLGDYVKKNYPDSKSDLSTVFMEKSISICKSNGFASMINIPVWMFLSSYEKLRSKQLINNTFVNMVHPGRGIFGSDFGTTTFVIAKPHLSGYVAAFRRLFNKAVEVETNESREISFLSGGGKYLSKQDRFMMIPGEPIAYWVGEKMLELLGHKELLGERYQIGSGLSTADNERFLRLFWEVESTKIAREGSDRAKWFLFQKGGDYRKWYGNLQYVVNWENDGDEIKYWVTHNPKDPNTTSWSRRIFNTDLYFLAGITWGVITSGKNSFRICNDDSMISNAAGGIFGYTSEKERYSLLGALNSKVWETLLQIINPTINTSAGILQKCAMPVLADPSFAERCVALSKEDWNSFETSWEFRRHPLVPFKKPDETLVFTLKIGEKQRIESLKNGCAWFGKVGGYIERAERENNDEQGDRYEGIFARCRASSPIIGEVIERLDGDLEIIEDGDYVLLRRFSSKNKYAFCMYGIKSTDLTIVGEPYLDPNGQYKVKFRYDINPKMFHSFLQGNNPNSSIQVYGYYCSPGQLHHEIERSLNAEHLNWKKNQITYDIDLSAEFYIEPTDDYPELFHKRKDLSYQQEHRFLILDDNAEEKGIAISFHPLSERAGNLSGGELYLEGTAICAENSCLLSDRYNIWDTECKSRFDELKANEEKLNRIFIDIYGLQDELTPEVEDKDVTVRKADLQREIRSLISYAVGCMFGRYSLDVDGLCYAGGEWDASKYTTFQPGKDAILPICDDEYFEDDIVSRFVKFIEVVYGKDTLEENLKFIADALGGKGSPRDVIRSYFLNDFYADHLKIYQKRPIYWLFDSGKKNGFKCLIYMHRYQPDTIARIRTDYVHEQQSRYRTAIADLEARMAAASTAERVKLNKQLQKLRDQAEELRVYEEKIHHLADQMIPIDLDDGVKVNYAKFQDVLAKIK